MKGLNLKARLQEFTTLLPFMEGRDKDDLMNLHGKEVTIREYGFLEDKDKEGNTKHYICFIIDEDPKAFYFGGQVLTDNFMKLEAEGFHDAIVEEGVRVKFGSKKSKNKMTYTTVEYL